MRVGAGCAFGTSDLHRLSLILLAGLAVSGCAGRHGVAPSGSTFGVADENALALPPPGGPAVVSIIERRYNNAIAQDIFLFTSASTPGQNYLHVAFFGPVGPERDSPNRLQVQRMTDVTIAHELRREFPKTGLKRSAYYLQNTYGPFNYAVGQGRGDDLCLYGWQQVQSQEARRSAFENQGIVQVRLRLCQAGATEEELLSVMYNFSITGSFQSPRWNPYGDPPAADPRLGVTGEPMYPPLDTKVETPVRDKPDRIVRPVGRRVETTAIVRPQERKRLAASGVTVPSPTMLTSAETSDVVVPTPSCATTGQESGACR